MRSHTYSASNDAPLAQRRAAARLRSAANGPTGQHRRCRSHRAQPSRCTSAMTPSSLQPATGSSWGRSCRRGGRHAHAALLQQLSRVTQRSARSQIKPSATISWCQGIVAACLICERAGHCAIRLSCKGLLAWRGTRRAVSRCTTASLERSLFRSGAWRRQRRARRQPHGGGRRFRH